MNHTHTWTLTLLYQKWNMFWKAQWLLLVNLFDNDIVQILLEFITVYIFKWTPVNNTCYKVCEELEE